jgi:hopanoid C-2 methylase
LQPQRLPLEGVVLSPDRKPRVLLVVAHFDDTRNPNGRPNFIPQGLAHAFLAGAFHHQNVEVRLYSEFHSGPLKDERAFAWPDMLVLTGVTSAFDRMRQLAAYVRIKSPRCVVVAGGPAVRNLPISSAAAFDYACHGDIEELATIADEEFGPDAVAEQMLPRFDLLTWKSLVNYVETSRYCNFRCTFCALTAEHRDYKTYDLSYIENQIRSYREKKPVLFIDNNFYGNNRSHFFQKLDLLTDLVKEGALPGWIALVTGDFFADSQNVVRAHNAGCIGLFSGVESFNADQIKSYNKRQNLLPQIEVIKGCYEAGVIFQYGLIFDPTTQPVQQMQDELDFVIRCDSIPLPAFTSLTIPLLGTPLFQDRVKSRHFLPLTKLRDMDGFTLLTKPLDEMDRVLPFVKSLVELDGRFSEFARRGFGFLRRYWRSLSAQQIAFTVVNSFPRLINKRRTVAATDDDNLTYISTTQPLGPLYSPMFTVPERYRASFSATMITDSSGELETEIVENLSAKMPPPVRGTAVPQPLSVL